MTDQQRRRRASYQAILDHFDAHPDAWVGRPPVGRVVTEWRGLLTEVDSRERAQAQDTTGKTRTRDEQVGHVLDLAMIVIRKLRAYARLEGDAELLPIVDLSRTSLDHMNDAEMVTELANVTAATRARLDALPEYDLTAAELDTLDAEAAKILPQESTRVSAEDAQAVATARLRVLFAASPPLREILDDLVDSVITDEDFRAGYHQARKVTG